MANKNQPIGLKPHGELLRIRKYEAGSTVYPGDPVAIATDGQVDSSITVPLLGVAMNYATVGQDLMVADHPDQMFEVEADEALTQASVSGNFDLVLGTASTTYKRSAAYLDGSTIATTATLAAKIVAIADGVDNEIGSDNVDVIIKINNHVLNGGTGTAGLA
jgi:hypothetical protein